MREGQSPRHKMECKTSGTFPRSKQPKALLSVRFSLPECSSPLPAALLALTTFWGPTNHSPVLVLEQASFTLPSLRVLSVYNLSPLQVIILCQI